MARALDRDKLLTAAASTTLQIVVYGGSALMLASNFRFATEDADVAPLEKPWPEWLQRAVERITAETGWAEDWFNDGVAFHLSPIADHAVDHLEFGTFPRDGTPPGLIVYVPSASYLLALKLKAIRITDPLRGEQERLDILNLMRVVGIRTIDEAIVVLARYFPASGASAEKQRFLLKHTSKERSMRPSTLAEAVERVRAGVSQDVSMAEFVDSFLLAPDKGARFAAIEREPEFSGDVRLDALVAAVAEYLAKQYRLGRVPAWASQPRRCLDEPWFTTSSASPAMREYLSVVSPAEFHSHNIFTEERPLRRARSHLPYLSEARASSDLA